MVATKQRTIYRLDELDNLIHRLRCDPVSEEELAYRRRLAEESRRILEEQSPISIPVEDLMRAEEGSESD